MVLTDSPEFVPEVFPSHELPHDSPAYVIQRCIEIEGLLQCQAAILAEASKAARASSRAYRLRKAQLQLEAADMGFKTQELRNAYVDSRTDGERTQRDVDQIAYEYARDNMFAVKDEIEAVKARMYQMQSEFKHGQR